MGDHTDPELGAGRGFFRTWDGGKVWQEVGSLGKTTFVTQILPLDNIGKYAILVGGNDGLWRSEDAGNSFSKVEDFLLPVIWSLKSLGLGGGRVVLSGQNPLGDGRIAFSLDSGESWALATMDAAATSQKPLRMTLASSPSNPDIVWGIANKVGGFCPGLFKSIDGGMNWTFIQLPMGVQFGGQSKYNQMLAVHPENSDVVYVAADGPGWRTRDGGISWEMIFNSDTTPQVHGDAHSAAWSLRSAGAQPVLFMGNDGGLSILKKPLLQDLDFQTERAPDVTYIDNSRNNGLVTHLVYEIGSTTAPSLLPYVPFLIPWTPSDNHWRVLLGMQDNGFHVRREVKSSGFDQVIVGDGFSALWHPQYGAFVLATTQTGGICRSEDAGVTFNPIIKGILPSSIWPFRTRFRPGLADKKGDTVYTWANNEIYISTNFGGSWKVQGLVPPAGVIVDLAPSPINRELLGIVMTAGATVGSRGYVSSDQGNSWRPMGRMPQSDSLSPTRGTSMSSLVFSPSHEGTLYAAAVTQDTAISHMWRSTDFGTTWTAIDQNLDGTSNGYPFGLPVYVLRTDPLDGNIVFAGTDFGIYASPDGGFTWSAYGTGLPMVAVRDIYLSPDRTFLRVATFGRGAWEARYERPGNGDGGTFPFPIAVSVLPEIISLTPYQTQTFRATVIGTVLTRVTWEVLEGLDAGSITPEGVYTAPGVPGIYHVVARSLADPSVAETIEVSVNDPVGDP